MTIDMTRLFHESTFEYGEQQDRERGALMSTVTEECANAIETLAYAIKYPAIARDDLERAMEHVRSALVAAEKLDPKSDGSCAF